MKIVFFFALFPCLYLAQADEIKDFANSTLTGDWNTSRTNLHKRGVDIDLNYVLDSISNTSGGTKSGSKLVDEINFTANFDGNKLFGIDGNSGKLYIYRNNFGHPNEQFVGAIQGIDNNESTYDLTNIDEAWLQQNFLNNKLSILAGLYDFKDEFYSTGASGLFINSAFGIGSELSNTYGNSSNLYTSNALATRVKILPTNTSYVQLVLMDAIPNIPKNQKKSHYHFYRGSGALLIVETGITPTTNDKFSFGAWMYTKKFSDLINTKKFKRNYGIYGLLEKELFKNPKNHNQIITNFLRIGSADGNTTRFNYAWTCGINFQGIIPSREKGIAGIAFQQAINSNTFRLSKQIDSISTLKSEYGIELTYQDFVTPWLTLQPDVQYIFNPGATPGIKNALVIGLRAQIYL